MGARLREILNRVPFKNAKMLSFNEVYSGFIKWIAVCKISC